MKTDDLIALLATGAEPVAAGALSRRWLWALAAGMLAAALAMALLLGVRPDLDAAVRLPMFWVKLLFPGTLLGAALLAVLRLSRPGARLGRVPAAMVAPVLAVWVLAAVVLLGAAPGERSELLFGHSWRSCPFTIALLALPLFAASLCAMRDLAPTRLALAGAAAGLLAGAGGAVLYSLYCIEMAAPFLGVWYLLGMLLPAAAGAVAGPRLLRW